MRWAGLLLLASGCQLVFPLEAPDPGDVEDGGPRDTGADDAPPARPCVPSSFATGVTREVMWTGATPTHFSLPIDESYAILVLQTGELRFVRDLSSSTPAFDDMQPVNGPTGPFTRASMAADESALMLGRDRGTEMSLPQTPPGTWQPNVGQSISLGHAPGRPADGGRRMMVETEQNTFQEWVFDGERWDLVESYTAVELSNGFTGTLAQYPSLSRDGLVLVYVLSGGGLSGIHHATRRDTGSRFAYGGSLVPLATAAQLAPQLSTDCQRLWLLEMGEIIRLAQPGSSIR